MFIAVIQESFDVSEDEKRLQQVKAFLQKKEVGGSSNGFVLLPAWLSALLKVNMQYTCTVIRVQASSIYGQASGPLGLWSRNDGNASQGGSCQRLLGRKY